LIFYTKGDLFDNKCECLVNTVNEVGVISQDKSDFSKTVGKGLALEFKKKFPVNYSLYKSACFQKKIKVGEIFVYETNMFSPHYIFNFPTKKHWKQDSLKIWIEDGLKDLVKKIRQYEIPSIAIPMLGCCDNTYRIFKKDGNGNLNWSEIKPLIEHYLKPLKNLTVFVYESENNTKKGYKTNKNNVWK
jgi:O-acetyl-ADP-ribose deacetylase (regulator of RNase III)